MIEKKRDRARAYTHKGQSARIHTQERQRVHARHSIERQYTHVRQRARATGYAIGQRGDREIRRRENRETEPGDSGERGLGERAERALGDRLM